MPKLPYDAELIETREITDGVVWSREWFVLIRTPEGAPIHLPLPGATKENAEALARAAIDELARAQKWG